ncbi:MAG: cobalamin-binding protein [Acidobacteriota bacterium]|jgi:iron complex transport system substrate-binding protein|nr:cobalamin-binding protein [Acidobacteriota bacterium]NLT33463.1 cobalamin-binding protein [Acidobacteriota bacterium]
MSRNSDPCHSPLPVRACIVAALLVLLAFAAGCAPRPADGPGEEGVGMTTEPGMERVEVTDGTGRRVSLPRRPRRIISLAPNVTETLFMLGAQDRLIGVTTLCTWPEAARALPKIGDLLNPNNEVILAARPDLVIGSTAGNDRGAITKLIGLGLPVYVDAPRSVEDIFRSVEEIGRITDCAGEGGLLAARMRERLDNVRRRIEGLPPVRAFFITWFNPLLAPGKNTFENDVLALAGVASISADIPQYYPRYSLEQVLVSDPDAILTIEHDGDPLPRFGRTPGWKELRAVREGRVYYLSEYLQHPSPLFVDGVEDLARQLYPERFR